MDYTRRLRMMVTALAALTGGVLLFNFLINPFGTWRHRLVSGIYYRVRASHERVTTPYLLRSTQPSTVIFGTSRVLMGIPIEQGIKDGILNAAMSAARPEEIAKGVALALKNPHLKRVIWGVDFFTFDERFKPDPDTTARMNGSVRLLVLDNLLSAQALDSSYHLLGRALSGRRWLDPKVLEPIPWAADFICGRFAHYPAAGLSAYGERGALQQVVADMAMYRGSICCGAAMAQFAMAIDQIRLAHLELVVFVPPLSQYELETIRQNGLWPRFQQWKRALAGIVSYWDFSGYNQIARTDTMFTVIPHVKPEVGMTILNRLLGKTDARCQNMRVVLDAGLWMDRGNVDQVLALQDRREQAANAQPNKYAEVVARAIAQDGENLTSASR